MLPTSKKKNDGSELLTASSSSGWWDSKLILLSFVFFSYTGVFGRVTRGAEDGAGFIFVVGI